MSPENGPGAIVGIGASAGGLEAFSTLLRNLPADTGMGFVLVQHLDPRHQSILPELLAGRTRMPVVQVAENTEVRPNHVYVIPPNSTMVISRGVLHLLPRGPSERHMPIDTFFTSLAEDRKHASIGVVLSGVASDGTLGLRAIKAEGGITFAQDDTATFDGMPHSAIHMGVVDSVLPPDRIAEELAAISRHPLQSAEGGTAVADEPTMQKFFALLRTSRGIDFSQYKRPTVQRRLARRMVLMKAGDPEEYLEILRQTPGEVEALFNDLLINVTEFFRDPPVFDALKETAFPMFLTERRAGEQPVRIWVPGCSTGEEVYSIAISLAEYLESNNRDDAVQIFGTDVSPAAVQKARQGIYSKEAVAPVSPERLRRFFTKVDSGHQISRNIREMCIFSLQNITRDPPLSRMDLISCRNLLIYLGPHMQRRVLGIFLYALQPSGCLLLGTSETPGAVPDLFVAVDRANRIFRRKLAAAQPHLDLPSREASLPPFTATPVPAVGEARKAPELPAIPAPLPRRAMKPPASLAEARGQIAALEEELSSTKQYLQTIIEELRSANEEAQSSNEELQSANEELQTAKEELQSSNEELVTLNAEVQGRNAELDLLNNDLVNLLSNLNVPIVMVDGNLRIRRFTPVAEKVLNLIATDVGRPISDLQPRINVPNLEEILRNVIETLSPHEQEVQDQEGRWYSLRVRPYRTVDNRIEGAVLQLVDVTDRKRAAEARYRRLFEAAKDGILIVDAVTGEITDANPFAEHLLGYSLAELVGRRLWDAGPLREIPQARDLVARALEEGAVPFLEMSLTTRDGSQMQVEAVANAYDEGSRKVVQFSVRDVTERKRFERQLLHTQKLESLGLLAGGIAHDFNNLLTTIMGNASLAITEIEDNEAQALLGQVIRASERAANLTRQMLAYAGKGRLLTEPVDLHQMIGELAVLVRSSLPKIIGLNLDLEADLPFIEGDSSQIQQIIMNLVINGGEAIAEGRPGSVTVRTGVRELTARQLHEYLEGQHLAAGRYVVLEVVDTGAGMDDETKARIFDPFFTTKFTGRGLGLAAVLGIIRSHLGAIRVDTQLGRGTSFKVLFPAAAARPEPRPAASARSLAGTGTVLVVDDEEPLRVLAKAGLERNGYHVILADNGAAAVRIFRAHHDEISLVVLDRTMPVMGGEEALEQLQAIDEEVPVILSSGYDQASTLEQVAGSHLAGFIQKPYTIETLLETVQKALVK